MSTRTDYVGRLRKLADLLEATPDLILPDITKDTIKFFCFDAAQTAATAKLMPTGWAKNDPNSSNYDASYYVLTGQWAGFSVVIAALRTDVCERVQVGTETVTVPAAEAVPETVVVRPVYEWQCAPLLAKAAAS